MLRIIKILFFAVILFGFGTWLIVRLYGPSPFDKVDFTTADISYSIVDSQYGGYGYEIYVNKKLYINAHTLGTYFPVKGFKTKGDAEKTAQYMISKLKKGNKYFHMSKSIYRDLGVDYE